MTTMRKHSVLTVLTAYAPWEGFPAVDPKKCLGGARLGRTRRQLAEFLSRKKGIPGTSVELQPVIVAFDEEPHEKAGWCYEHGGDGDSFLGHMSSLYEVTPACRTQS